MTVARARPFVIHRDRTFKSLEEEEEEEKESVNKEYCVGGPRVPHFNGDIPRRVPRGL